MPQVPKKPVHTVHLTFSHHLDVGLDLPMKITANCVGFATKIVQRYFDEFIPNAINLAQQMINTTTPFRYQIHPWIASLYANCVPWAVSDGCTNNPGTLRCPSKSAVKLFSEALRRGDLVFTASPFNINAEAVGDPSLFLDLPSIAGDLAAQYNLSKPTVWSNVDVKSFARSAVPLLRKAGIHTLYIGANGSPRPPEQQRTRGLQPVCGSANATMFRWFDPPSGEEITVLYTAGYGSYLGQDVLGAGTVSASSSLVSPNGVALVSYFATDNAGPPSTPMAVRAIYAKVCEEFSS